MKYQVRPVGSLLAAFSLSMPVLLFSPLCLAETQTYLGVGLGYTEGKNVDELFGVSYETESAVGELKDTSSGFTAYLGVRLPYHFALELAYLDMGQYEFNDQEIQEGANSLLWKKGSIEFSGPALSLRFDLPVGSKFDTYARAGLMNLSADYTVQVNMVDIASNQTVSSFRGGRTYTEHSLFYSLGGEYHVTQNTSMYFEYTIVEGEFSDVNMDYEQQLDGWFLGLTYNFGSSMGDQNKGANKQDGRKRAITACDPDFSETVGGTACE